MKGQNWHQVLDEMVKSLASGLQMPCPTGFRHLLLMAALENTADVAITFDLEVRLYQGVYTLGRGEELPTGHHLRLPPGTRKAVCVDECLDCGDMIYGVAEHGRQDLYVLAHH